MRSLVMDVLTELAGTALGSPFTLSPLQSLTTFCRHLPVPFKSFVVGFEGANQVYVIGVYGQVRVARLQLVEFALLSGATTVLRTPKPEDNDTRSSLCLRLTSYAAWGDKFGMNGGRRDSGISQHRLLVKRATLTPPRRSPGIRHM